MADPGAASEPANADGKSTLTRSDLVDVHAIKLIIEYIWHVVLLAIVLGGFYIIHFLMKLQFPDNQKLFGTQLSLADVVLHIDVIMFLSMLGIGGLKTIVKFTWVPR